MKRFIESGGGSDLEALRERRAEEEAALAAQVQEERISPARRSPSSPFFFS